MEAANAVEAEVDRRIKAGKLRDGGKDTQWEQY
jgi:hypothetical protein